LNQAVLKQEAQSSSEQLCLLLIGINMMSTVLCQVIELPDVLVVDPRTLVGCGAWFMLEGGVRGMLCRTHRTTLGDCPK
jgi:hypothetical protein